jgi:hypothetical protein
MFIGAMDGGDCRVNGLASAGMNIVPKLSWSVLLSRAPWGFQRGAWRVAPLWVLSALRRQADQNILNSYNFGTMYLLILDGHPL